MNGHKRRVKVAVISDVHLGFIGCRAKELDKYLESILPEILIINGDFIDIWQFRSYYFPKSHSKVLERVFKFISEGVKVHLLTGNHDEMLRRYSGLKLGNLTLEDKLLLNLDGKQHWFFHGDIFDISMQGSRVLAKLGTTGYEILILLNKLFNFFLGLLGKPKSSFSQDVKAATKRGVKKLRDYAITGAEIAAENGYQVVINGHSHIPEIKTIDTPNGPVLYLNSGDWVENMTALEYNNAEWKLIWFKDLTFPSTWLEVEEGDLP
jgi:UDP-2,3-diacylglucosamine pyrophosphatase LpxH